MSESMHKAVEAIAAALPELDEGGRGQVIGFARGLAAAVSAEARAEPDSRLVPSGTGRAPSSA